MIFVKYVCVRMRFCWHSTFIWNRKTGWHPKKYLFQEKCLFRTFKICLTCRHVTRGEILNVWANLNTKKWWCRKVHSFRWKKDPVICAVFNSILRWTIQQKRFEAFSVIFTNYCAGYSKNAFMTRRRPFIGYSSNSQKTIENIWIWMTQNFIDIFGSTGKLHPKSIGFDKGLSRREAEEEMKSFLLEIITNCEDFWCLRMKDSERSFHFRSQGMDYKTTLERLSSSSSSDGWTLQS